MADLPNELSPAARAAAIVSQITSVALGMVAPGLLGWLVDRQVGWTPVLTILGFVFGLCFGIWQLQKLIKKSRAPKNTPPADSGDDG